MKKDEVKHIAKLAQLNLTEPEVRKFQHQLSEILAYVEQLKKVETKNVEPTSQVTGLVNIFRQDKQDNLLAKQENFFKIKAIFEK